MSLIRIRTNGEEVQFRPDAAASFRRVERQAGREVSVNRTVVTYVVQEELYERRQRGEYPHPVAHPDESDHVYRDDDDGGNAWDTEERGEWLDEHGWIADVKGEPWHRRYVPGRDKHINDPHPITDKSEEDMTMKRLMQIDPNVDGRWFVVDNLAGTAVRQWNGFQLDRCREDVNRGEALELAGPQPTDAIKGLTIING